MFRRVYLVVAVCLSVLFPCHSDATSKTLGEIRKELLGKEVIISGVKGTGLGNGEDVFLEWSIAEGDSQQGFKKRGHGFDFAPYRFKGSKGVVESIELANSFLQNKKKGISTDAFGDTVKDDASSDPYFDIVVKLPDGTFLIATGYYLTIMGANLELASNVAAVKEEIVKNLDSLIGQVILPVAYSKVYPPDADISNITDVLRGEFNTLHDVPNLTPLKITKAKYIDAENGVLLKVEFLGDRTGFIFSQLHNDERDRKSTLLQRATLGFLTKIPKALTDKEVKAIKKSDIFRGMSFDALEYSWGFAKKKNDWGSGGLQLIYSDNQIVYIRNKKVVDWQSL